MYVALHAPGYEYGLGIARERGRDIFLPKQQQRLMLKKTKEKEKGKIEPVMCRRGGGVRGD
jgi:hypothetical protein